MRLRIHPVEVVEKKMQALRGNRRRLIIGIIIACGVANAVIGLASNESRSSSVDSNNSVSLVEKRLAHTDSIVVRVLRSSFMLVKVLQRLLDHEE